MTPDPEDIVELSSAGHTPDGPAPGPQGKPFLRLWFRCAGLYGRAYKTADGTQYVGRCSKCAQNIRFQIGEGGTDKRFFEVSC